MHLAIKNKMLHWRLRSGPRNAGMEVLRWEQPIDFVGINIAILPGASRFMTIHIHIYQYLLKYIAVGIPDTARYCQIHHTSSFINTSYESSYFKRIRNCIDDFNQESFSNGVWDALKLPSGKLT